jgi:hypothetical protein
MAEIKKVPNNVRGRRKHSGGQTVDPQILRWRKELKKQGIVLGKGMAREKKIAEESRERRKHDTDEKLAAKKWF